LFLYVSDRSKPKADIFRLAAAMIVFPDPKYGTRIRVEGIQKVLRISSMREIGFEAGCPDSPIIGW
jgi:hypothetical protein